MQHAHEVADDSNRTQGLSKIMDEASSSGRKEPQFNVTCPVPGCSFTAAGKTAPLTIKKLAKHGNTYFYVLTYHYKGQRDKKNVYTSHIIGTITKVGTVLYYDANKPEILRKVALKADDIMTKTIAKASAGPPRKVRPAKSVARRAEQPRVDPQARPRQAEQAPPPHPTTDTSLETHRRTAAPVKRRASHVDHVEGAIAEKPHPKGGVEGVFEVFGGYPDQNDLKKAGVTDEQIQELTSSGNVFWTFHADFKNHPNTRIYVLRDVIAAKESNSELWRLAATAMWKKYHEK